MTGTPTPPLKWHGGKRYLTKKIVALMPPRCKNPNAPKSSDPGWLHYVEPYFGGGSVMLANDPQGISEVANDLNGHLTNFWRVLQDTEQFARFVRRIEATPFSAVEWNDSQLHRADPDPVTRACAFFIHCRQSLAGRMASFTGITKTRTRRGMNNEVSAWLTGVEGLAAIHERLKRVVILNRDALDVIRQQDEPRTLFYLDPPYLHETRTAKKVYGDYEMTDEQHQELLKLLARLKGKFLLSSYRSKR